MSAMELIDLGVASASAPVLVASVYLALLAVVAKRGVAPRGSDAVRFDVIVPAHDEEASVGATVESLLAQDYPRDAFRVVVVADNCTDATAARAHASGAQVLERTDASRRGKGFALAMAFERSLDRGDVDAVVVVDADTRASHNLLRALAARLAAGERAVQAEYGVRNPDASWRTRLMVLAMALFHTLRSRARERLGLSCGLRGNGMAIACSALREVPYDAFSIVEDVEYGVRLGLAGHRVAYAGEATVLGEMPSTARGATSQRARWESGRRALRQAFALPLVRRGLAEQDAVLLDLGTDLLVPPLARLVAWIVAGLAISAALALPHALATWSIAAACVAFYVARGAQISGLGLRALGDLAWAPVYAAWKLAVPSRLSATWERTAREKSK